MIRAMGGQPPIYQPPLPVFRPGGGAGHHSRIMQFLAGNPLNRNQIARMENGQTPGGFHGAFSQLNPAVLMQLAQLLQGAGNGQLQGGQPPVAGGINPAGNPTNGLPFRTVMPPEGGVMRPIPPGIQRLVGRRGMVPPQRRYPVR